MKPYYSHNGITIYHADCREVLPTLPDKSFGISLTDPPYGIGVRYGDQSDDNRPDYWAWLQGVVDEMRRLSQVVVFTHRVAALQHLQGWDWIASWTKPWSSGTRLGNSCVVPHWEPIFLYGIHSIGTKSQFTSDVFSYSPEPFKGLSKRGRESWEKKQETHPCPKPEGLFRDLLTAFGQKGGTVLDPFMGSGTTLAVAKALGRPAVGIEIEERYCEIAAKRLQQQGVVKWTTLTPEA